MPTGHRWRVLGAALPFVVLLAACAPGGTSSQPKAPTGGKVSTDVASMGQVNLKMLDWWQGDTNAWVGVAVKAFEKKYPNITIKRTIQDWSQLTDTLHLRLAEDNGPDIATVNNGWQSLGTLAKGGLVLNLDNYARAYKWQGEIPSTIMRQTQFTTDGKGMGSGSLYASPVSTSSLIGLYYNKTILKKAGVAPPTTLAEFEAACAAVKKSGQIPIAYGSQEKASATAILFAIQDLFGDKQKLNDFIYSDGHVAIADTGMTQAAELVKKWANAGWLTKNYQGIQYADAVDAFMRGRGAFRFDYTGSLPFKGAQKSEYGYVQLPQPSTGHVVGTGASTAMAISAKSKHPAAAAAFLDYLAGPEVAQIVVDHGLLPLLHKVKVPSDNPVFATEIAGQQALDRDNGYVPYFDWSTPPMLDTIGTQVQLLLAGKVTPQQLTAAGQKDYDAFQKQRNG
jgi:raffinose/stachyose/melibiose transport system substrate-binding protein